jgi:hypothetical protein
VGPEHQAILVVGIGMEARPPVILALLAMVAGCESGRKVELATETERTVVLGAPPGAFLPSSCMGEDDLRSWRRFDPNHLTEEQHESARGSQCGWSVVLRDGIPIVSAAQRFRFPAEFSRYASLDGVSALQRTAAGDLLGTDGGEWGGSLRWYSAKGELKQTLLEDNVVGIIPAFGQFVALTYVGHGSRGRAIEVLLRGGRFEIGRTVDLPVRPVAGAVEREGTILIASGKGLHRLSAGFAMHPVLEATWWRLHPTSLALGSATTAYVGLRGVVVELQLATTPPKQTWLYPF